MKVRVHPKSSHYKEIFFFFGFFHLAVPGVSFGVWDLIPRPGIEPVLRLHWEHKVIASGPPETSWKKTGF